MKFCNFSRVLQTASELFKKIYCEETYKAKWSKKDTSLSEKGVHSLIIKHRGGEKTLGGVSSMLNAVPTIYCLIPLFFICFVSRQTSKNTEV